MSLLTPEECIAHCSADPADASLLADLLAGAESAVAGYLNRAYFATQAELSAAQDALPKAAGDAQDAYEAAMAVAADFASSAAREMAIDLATERLKEAKIGFQRVLFGMVATPRIRAAVRLTLGNLYANREEVVVGASAVRLPQGVPELLRPDRREMMP
ncbi:head-tail connector protein [Achromobacter marplatensis]|uniref:Phage gp6-like head-tail connector protein n=1 Tax=Achromobacter marplatensis TaxID=470868 RepID=A0AA42WEN4_9BURK|nr:head-tail connector protein [Achromobacter marplatensis]MDH2052856.1 phage gp6-like head-tail connector protein [Achromobacter marplatensis]